MGQGPRGKGQGSMAKGQRPRAKGQGANCQGPGDKGQGLISKVSCDRWPMGKALVRLLEMYL